MQTDFQLVGWNEGTLDGTFDWVPVSSDQVNQLENRKTEKSWNLT